MKKIIAIGASNSRHSINQQLANWAAEQVKGSVVSSLDLNDFEMPIYSIDRESGAGIPIEAMNFKSKLNESDGIVISLAEHNGNYTAAFKNITDWVSRIENGTWSNKPVMLLATSQGPRGGQGVLDIAKVSMPYQRAAVSGVFSLPSFAKNFNPIDGIINSELKTSFLEQLEIFEASLIYDTVIQS